MKAQDYYDILRKQGFTDNITSNPDPNYNQDFYQNIFDVMEGYARKYLESKLKEELQHYENWITDNLDLWESLQSNESIDEYLKYKK